MQLLPYEIIEQALARNDTALIQKGRKTCLAILKQNPHHLIGLRLIASIDYQKGHFAQAEKWLAQALAIQPDSAELCFNYALTLIKQEKLTEAIVNLQRAAELDPQQIETFYYLGILYEAVGKNADAITAYQTALQLAPNSPELLYQLGTVLMAVEQFAEAEDYFRRVLILNPQNVEALNNLGNIMYFQGKFMQSITLFKQALEIQPDYLAALGNLATALDSAGLLSDAIAVYRQAIAMHPDNPEIHVNLATALLADGQMDEGWHKFEKRTELIHLFANRPEIKRPLWRGEDGAGRTILIRAEQGYGDTIQFCRYVPLVAARGFRVILEVQPPLVRLLQSLSGYTQIIAYGDSLPKVDCYCPIMSLPFIFHTRLDTIPNKIPYLSVPEMNRREWHQRISSTASNQLKVGIVWAGKQRDASLELATAGHRRSMAPVLFAPLLTVTGIQFYSLQKIGPQSPGEFDLIDIMDECKDFADTAAFIMNLDLVISVDTAVAHLAAALGKPVWLLNRFDCCWRWLKTREDSPWYPTLRIFRQPKPGDWHSVIECVQKELQTWIKQPSSMIP